MAIMTKRSNTTITLAICALSFLPFILLILVCVSTPISDKLQLSQLYDGSGRLLINLGLLGACAKPTDEGADYTRGADRSRKSMGYYVRPTFAINSSDPTWRQSQIEIVHFEETWPLVLLPMVTGFIGFSMILFTIAWPGGSRKWAGILHIVNFSFQVFNTVIAWVAFGMCIRMTKEINRVVADPFYRSPNITLPLEARYGNAVWLALVAAILLLIGTILYGVKMFGGRSAVPETYINRKDVELEQVSSQ